MRKKMFPIFYNRTRKGHTLKSKSKEEENYRPILLTGIDIKTLSKTKVNQD